MNEYLIGLDLGATNIKCVLYHKNSKNIIQKIKMPFSPQKTIAKEFEKNVIRPIQLIVKSATGRDAKIAGIAIATGALFNRGDGRIINWPNHRKWNGFTLVESIKEKFSCSVIIEEDANSAALGEFIFGKAKNEENFAYITVSTGIGCGIVLNGKLHIGSNGFAGEIGHIPMGNRGIECQCGGKDCLQSLASGRALLNGYNSLYQRKDSQPILCLSQIISDELDEKTGFDLFKEAGILIGRMIITLVMILDLPVIVLGGGVIANNILLKEHIEKCVYEHLSILERKIEIRVSDLCDDNGVLGIMALAHETVYHENLEYLNMEVGDYS